MNNEQVISTLNDLIETSKDGERGFSTSAENVSDSELKKLFTDRARACGEAARVLQKQVQRLGGDPDTTGSTSGAVHAGWTDLKSSIVGQDEKAILQEVERGEDIAVKAYRKALDSDLPTDIRELVERQYQGVQQNHDQVRDLRDRYQAQ